MFVLLMSPKHISNKSAHGWHANTSTGMSSGAMFLRVIQDLVEPALKATFIPLFTYFTCRWCLLETLLVHSWRRPGYNLCFRKYSSPYLQADSLVPGFAVVGYLFCLWVIVMCMVKMEGLEEVFPGKVFWCCLPQEQVTSISQFKLDHSLYKGHMILKNKVFLMLVRWKWNMSPLCYIQYIECCIVST